MKIPSSVTGFGHEATVYAKKNGHITVKGERKSNDIRVEKTCDDRYEVTVNGRSHTYTKDELQKLTIKGGKRSDKIYVGEGVDVPVKILGGKGADRIENYADNAVIHGGRGKDTILNAGNNARINGGRGNDVVLNDGDNATIRGGRGRDFLSNNGNGGTMHGGRGHDIINANGEGTTILSSRGRDTLNLDPAWLSGMLSRHLQG
jgi:Ca2+-binding RTX toxin-like protein